jgi:hypothetical protein
MRHYPSLITKNELKIVNMAVENIAKTSHLLNPYGNAAFGT